MHEEAILDWVLELRDSSPDVIENVDRKTLQVGTILRLQEPFLSVYAILNFKLNTS